MTYVKWTFLALIALLLGSFLNYCLPGHDVVRIVGSEVRRVETRGNSIFWAGSEPSNATTGSRDVKFISAIRQNDRPVVYRNEDTGWGWPPYFKFNSSDLQARAADLTSTKEAPKWVLVKQYGWRNQLFSIYPNALSFKAVDGPDVRVIPWFNIVFLTGLAALFLLIRRLVRRFWARRIDPVVEDVTEAFEDVDQRADAAVRNLRGRRQRLREWFVERF